MEMFPESSILYFNLFSRAANKPAYLSSFGANSVPLIGYPSLQAAPIIVKTSLE